MSDPIDGTVEHVGRHAGRSGQTIASEPGRQIQRANDEHRRALQEAQRKADRDREQAVREAQRKAEREREKAEQPAAREQAAADRIAARCPDPERAFDGAAVAAETAVLATAVTEASATATAVDAGGVISDNRDETAAETASIAADGDADAAAIDSTSSGTNEAKYDEFELRDGEALRQAGADPDEVSTSSSADTSLTLNLPPAPEISRGDDGLER